MGAQRCQVNRRASHFGRLRNAGMQDRAGTIREEAEGERKDTLTYSSHMREDASGKTMSVLRHVCTAALLRGRVVQERAPSGNMEEDEGVDMPIGWPADTGAEASALTQLWGAM